MTLADEMTIPQLHELIDGLIPKAEITRALCLTPYICRKGTRVMVRKYNTRRALQDVAGYCRRMEDDATRRHVMCARPNSVYNVRIAEKWGNRANHIEQILKGADE